MRTFAEKILTIAMLFFTTAALSSFVSGNGDPLSRAEGSSIAIGIQVGLYSVALLFIATRWRPFLRGALRLKWVGALLALAVASSAWSQDPALTLRRSVLLVATTAFGVYFATRFEVSEQLKLLAWTLGISVFLSFLFGIFLRQYGIDSTAHSGDWQGIYSQKNALARAMVLSGVIFFFARKEFNRAVRWIGFFSSIGLLILSRSLSGLLIFLVLLGTIPLLKLLRARITFTAPLGIGLGVLFVGTFRFASPLLPDAFEYVNRDSTLTGRTPLWDAILIAISKRPFLGYGFDGFWLGMKGESANVLLSVHWPALHGHNGFLDLWLDLGLLGVGIFVIGYLALWRRAVSYLRSSTDLTALWLCTCLTFTLLYNLTESALVRENTIFWVLYTSTAVNLFLRKSEVQVEAESVSNYELEPNPNYLS